MAVEEITMQPAPSKTKPPVPLHTHGKSRQNHMSNKVCPEMSADSDWIQVARHNGT